MKVKVFTESLKEEEQIFFRLIQESNYVLLIACNATGEIVSMGNLLKINSNGELILISGVNREIGLKLDEAGYLQVMKG
jgi:hypothetical protein